VILKVHVHGAPSYDIGEEIWQQPLDEAIADEAQTIADHAGADLLESPEPKHREQLRRQLIADMTRALAHVGDGYRAPDGVLYSLIDEAADEERERPTMAAARSTGPLIVKEVVRLEELPPESLASHRAIVRWSDGSEGEALTWYADELHITEGELLGKTAEQLRSLHFRKDRDWLKS
jgi:hypothetical protein